MRVDDTPPLPAAYARALDAGLAALAVDLDPAARLAIDGHIRLLLAWTQAINLTAIRDPVAAATAHVLDSLTALPVLRERGLDRFVDLGSGGGLPGIPLAAALPAGDALLVEPVGKKARFLATAIAATDLAGAGRVRVAATRAETLARDPHHRGQWPAVTARAVASLADLVELSFPLLARDGLLLAWKRDVLGPELDAAARAVDALGGGAIEQVPVSLPGLDDHRLVLVTRVGSVPGAFPREPGVRKRRPW